MDYMSLAVSAIMNMSGWFALCVVAFFGIFVVAIVTRSINHNSRAIDEYNAKKLEYDHEIAKLVEQRKLMDTRLIEGTAKRLGQDINQRES